MSKNVTTKMTRDWIPSKTPYVLFPLLLFIILSVYIYGINIEEILPLPNDVYASTVEWAEENLEDFTEKPDMTSTMIEILSLNRSKLTYLNSRLYDDNSSYKELIKYVSSVEEMFLPLVTDGKDDSVNNFATSMLNRTTYLRELSEFDKFIDNFGLLIILLSIYSLVVPISWLMYNKNKERYLEDRTIFIDEVMNVIGISERKMIREFRPNEFLCYEDIDLAPIYNVAGHPLETVKVKDGISLLVLKDVQQFD